MPTNTQSGQPARQGDTGAQAMELGLVEEPSMLPIDTMDRLPELSFGMGTPSTEGGDDDLSKSLTPGKSLSKTVTETVTGQHEHTIVGYSLIKGIGDGEPIASERFEVGGHEWVLLFYPDGKRSSAELQTMQHAIHAATGANAGNGAMGQGEDGNMERQVTMTPSPIRVEDGVNVQEMTTPHQLAAQGVQNSGNEYCALFVALIGESESPQGVVSTSEGRVVRAFHRFTLVDQSNRGQDVSKGRRRDQGAVKISCARQDPNARYASWSCPVCQIPLHTARSLTRHLVLSRLGPAGTAMDTGTCVYNW